jgi:zinc/manganese transport system substrate-binding protein
MRIAKLGVTVALLMPLLAQAALSVVATSSSTGMLVREIGADQVNLKILGPPDRDLHYLQARPSMVRALRSADLVVALGAELEGGWLPVAIRQAANPAILPGRDGYFEAAAQVELLDTGGAADRALGDVHPAGNPHVNMDPIRMGQIGLALAEQLVRLDPTHAEDFRSRAAAFADTARNWVSDWKGRAGSPPGVVAFHRDLLYLLDRFDIPLYGTLEPVPGVPPSGAHIKDLADRLKGQRGLILFTSYQPAQGPNKLADILGWPLVRLPLEPPLQADGEAYLAHLDRWLEAIFQAE